MEVEKLTGAQLDYWVARAEGRKLEQRNGEWFVENDDRDWMFELEFYTPHKSWPSAGSIIESNNIQLSPPTSRVHRHGGPNAGWGQAGVWSACTWHRGEDGRRSIAHDEKSPLVAAMRCFVRSKFGEHVPDELPGAEPPQVNDLYSAAQHEDAYGDGHLDGPQ
jgi:hypothetical protein